MELMVFYERYTKKGNLFAKGTKTKCEVNIMGRQAFDEINGY